MSTRSQYPIRRFALLAGISALFGVLPPAAPASAATVILDALQDNTLYESVSGDLSNGAGDHLFAGTTDELLLRRGLIAFDLEAAMIPAGSTIDQVVLTLHLSRTRAKNETVTLHRALRSWGEGASHAPNEEGAGAAPATGDATWIHSTYPDSFWTAAGGDFVAAASGASTVGMQNGFYTWSSAGMIADVAAWLDSSQVNFGWVVVGNEDLAEQKNVKRFDTKDNGDVTKRPKLEIQFTPPVVVGGCCFVDSCAVLTSADCATSGGVYQGDGTTCSPNPCVVPTGACCFDDGTCQELSEADCLAQSGSYAGDGSDCPGTNCPVVLETFVDSLPRPAVAVPVSGQAGSTATYHLAMTQFEQRLHRDLPPTTVWGYAGSFPGPTIESTTDQPVTVRWINDLRDSTGTPRAEHYFPVETCLHGPDSTGSVPVTVVHLHGGHVPPEVDGYPEATFPPGGEATYVYPNNQHPGTLWYHDHALGITRLNVYMGLAGFFLVRDAAELALGLPAGEFEIPMAIQDRSFASDGSLVYPDEWQEMYFGDKILVNGKVWPYLNVKRGKYRFRLLNGSNSRVYRLALSNGDPFVVIGNEGGLLTVPVTRSELTITPGERFDVVVDFAAHAPGTEIELENDAPAPFPGTPGQGVITHVMRFVVQSALGHTAALPDTLRPSERLQETEADEFRDLVLDKEPNACGGSKWTINGLEWHDVTERPVLGSTEVWRFINRSGVTHPMHMHLVFFQVLDRQAFTAQGDSIVPVGQPIPPDSSGSGWKDTVPVEPGEMVRVIARFEDYAGLFPYHCHILEHEDHEMMRQFEVVEPVLVTDQGPVTMQLAQNFPNPFGPRTRIAFELPRAAEITMRVYDVRGRALRTLFEGRREAGRYVAIWDGRDDDGLALRSGIYVVRLEMEGRALNRKMALVR